MFFYRGESGRSFAKPLFAGAVSVLFSLNTPGTPLHLMSAYPVATRIGSPYQLLIVSPASIKLEVSFILWYYIHIIAIL